MQKIISLGWSLLDCGTLFCSQLNGEGQAWSMPRGASWLMPCLTSPTRDSCYSQKRAFLFSTSPRSTATSSTLIRASLARLTTLGPWEEADTTNGCGPLSLSEWRKGSQWFEVQRCLMSRTTPCFGTTASPLVTWTNISCRPLSLKFA